MQKITTPPAGASQRPNGHLYLGSNQLNLVNGVVTLVLLDAIPAQNTDGTENTVTHRITPGVAGFYSVVGQVMFKNCVVDKSYAAEILVNGGLIFQNWNHSSIGVNDYLCALCARPSLYLGPTDFVELHALSNSGDNTVDVVGGSAATYLELQRVR